MVVNKHLLGLRECDQLGHFQRLCKQFFGGLELSFSDLVCLDERECVSDISGLLDRLFVVDIKLNLYTHG